MNQLFQMRLGYSMLACIFVLGLFIQAAHSQTNQQPSASMESELISKIHMTNEMEIKAGDLAKTKGTTPEIKRYGDRLVRDHQMADKKVLNLAQKQGLTVSKPIPNTSEEQAKMDKQMTMMKNLEQSTGPEFDQAFLTMMDQGHDEAIQMLTQARDQLPRDSELRGLLGKMVPILKQHDQLATNLEKKRG